MSTDAKYIAVITTGSPQVSYCDNYDHFGYPNWADKMIVFIETV